MVGSVKFWVFAGFILQAVLCSEATHGCQTLLVELADSNSKYLNCITRFGSPVNICVQCVTEYRSVKTKYDDFLKGNDSSAMCQDIYIDKDKLNIIAHTHDIITNLWNEAYCDNCYNPDGTSSNETAQFATLAINYKGCAEHEQNDVCTNCKKEYFAMNALYEELKEKYKHEVCFDIQDKMNHTRENWTKTCGPETPKGSLVAFAAVSSAFTSIPILFYCGFFMYMRRQEENHNLILDEPSADREENVTQFTSQNTLVNAPSTSSGITGSTVSSDIVQRSTAKLLDLGDDEDLIS